jgi:hypothetical protein
LSASQATGSIARRGGGRRAAVIAFLVAAFFVGSGSVEAGAQIQRASSTESSDGKAGLVAYLSAVDKARAPYLVAGPALDMALQKVSSQPDATWLAAATKAKRAQQATSYLAGALKSLTPPAGLDKANSDLLQSAQLALHVLTQLSSALKTRNVAATNAAVRKFPSLTTQVDALELIWRTAVTAAANKVGLTVPSWVASLGS